MEKIVERGAKMLWKGGEKSCGERLLGVFGVFGFYAMMFLEIQ